MHLNCGVGEDSWESADYFQMLTEVCPAQWRVCLRGGQWTAPPEVKNLSAMQETWVPSLGLEDSLEKNMATHTSILAWENPWTESAETLRLQRDPTSPF